MRRLRAALRRRDRDELLAAGALVTAMVATDASGTSRRRAAVLLEAVLLHEDVACPVLARVEEAIEALIAGDPDADTLLADTWRALASGDAMDAPDRPSLSVAVQDYLATRLGPRTTLRELAADLGYCPAYVSATIRRLTGKRFTELRRAMQLDHACMLLAGGASVKEAALAAGFGDPAYLSRVFRKHHHMSPSRWRASE